MGSLHLLYPVSGSDESVSLKNKLDDFTQNKAIQKIRESYRVSREEKEELENFPNSGKNTEKDRQHENYIDHCGKNTKKNI